MFRGLSTGRHLDLIEATTYRDGTLIAAYRQTSMTRGENAIRRQAWTVSVVGTTFGMRPRAIPRGAG
jgi:hypothetical protein